MKPPLPHSPPSRAEPGDTKIPGSNPESKAVETSLSSDSARAALRATTWSSTPGTSSNENARLRAEVHALNAQLADAQSALDGMRAELASAKRKAVTDTQQLQARSPRPMLRFS